MFNIVEKIYNFITTSSLDCITAFSIIYQVMKDDPLIKQEKLRKIVDNNVKMALKNVYSEDKDAKKKLFKISEEVSKKIFIKKNFLLL